MNKKSILGVLMLTGLAACGGAQAAKLPTNTAPVASVPAVAKPVPAPAAGASVVVKAGSSPLGQILVDQDGNTLYAFTNDTGAKSTCTGTCAEAWPPAIVDASWSVAPGLDSGVFSTIRRDDGTEQLTAGRFPLYRFSGDARPGDLNGQGSGGVWFVVDTKANPIESGGASADTTAAAPTAPAATPAPPPAPVASVADSALGSILVGPDGRTMYGFTNDANGTSTCDGACATAWPPVIVDAATDLSALPNVQLFSIIDRADGSKQLKAGKWPLYFFSGDAAAGDVNGQGSAGKWFAVGEDGKLIKQ